MERNWGHLVPQALTQDVLQKTNSLSILVKALSFGKVLNSPPGPKAITGHHMTWRDWMYYPFCRFLAFVPSFGKATPVI
jgi:hypothetical protein